MFPRGVGLQINWLAFIWITLMAILEMVANWKESVVLNKQLPYLLSQDEGKIDDFDIY